MKCVLVSGIEESFGLSSVTLNELEVVNGGLNSLSIPAIGPVAAPIIGTYCPSGYNPSYNPGPRTC